MAETVSPQVPWRIDQWFSDIPAAQNQKLKIFFDELVKANKSMNLVSPKTIPFADAIHFADSISASRLIMGSQKFETIHEIGSGNGFPGLVLSTLFPEVKVIAVERDPKKCEFLKSVSSQMRLSNFQVNNQTVESLGEKSIAAAVTRGYANISKTILLLRKLVAPGGKVYHLKSEEWASEVAQIPIQLCSYWIPGLLGEYRLPVGEVKFSVVRTERTSS